MVVIFFLALLLMFFFGRNIIWAGIKYCIIAPFLGFLLSIPTWIVGCLFISDFFSIKGFFLTQFACFLFVEYRMFRISNE